MKTPVRSLLLFALLVLGGAGLAASAYRAYVHRFAAAEWPRQARYTLYYLLKPGVRPLLAELAAMYDSGTFPTVWDTTMGVHLSKALYRPEDMDGAAKYSHRPGIKKLLFALRVWGGHIESYETPDTPRIRELLERVGPLYLSSASYDDAGFRNTGAGTDPALKPVLFLGDSFADGYGVGDSEAFPAVFGRLAQTEGFGRAVNAAVNGYGPLEELHAYEKAVRLRGKPRLAVLQHFPNDVFVDYDAVVRGEFPDKDRLWAEHDESFRRLTARLRSDGVPLLVVAVPPKGQVADRKSPSAHYQERIERLCRAEEVSFVDPLPAFRKMAGIYFDWDPHLTPEGHRALAGILWKAVPR